MVKPVVRVQPELQADALGDVEALSQAYIAA